MAKQSTDRIVTAEYVLSPDEVRDALLLTGRMRSWRRKSVVQMCVAAVFLAVFVFFITQEPHQTSYWIVAAVLAAFIPLCRILPKHNESMYVGMRTDGLSRRFTAADWALKITASNGALTNLAPEKVATIRSQGGLLLIEAKENNQLYAVPQRVMTDEQLKTLDDILAESYADACAAGQAANEVKGKKRSVV